MPILDSQQKSCDLITKLLSSYSRSKAHIRPHFLVSGPSGVGKSYIIEKLAHELGIGFVNINAAQLTRDGISGNSLSKDLVSLAKYQNKPVIVFLDEFDKLFSGGMNSSDERSGVQHEILHIISSGTAKVIGQFGHYDEINTSNVLFVLGGAFGGDEHITLSKLLKMGIYPELVGRVNLHVPLPILSVEDMLKALGKDPLLIKYFKNEGITDKAKRLEIKKAIAKQLRKVFKNNIIGYRLLQRLIHQYFLYDGAYPEEEELPPFEVDDHDEEAVAESLNLKELNFGD